jgi:hypothetical protein
MPKTPATIIAPTPTDSRVLRLADRLHVSRADAYFSVAEAWTQLSLEADDDGIVKGWTPAALEALVDLKAADLGKTLVDLGLVGVAVDGLVLPAELRLRHRDAGDADGPVGDDRRKTRNAEAARRYRRRAKTLGKPLKPSRASSWRRLDIVAGHEIRAVEGEHGVYAVVTGARLGGEAFRKFTTGDKSWSLENVTLLDALPGLLAKWKGINDKEAQAWDVSKRRQLEPSYDAFRAECERLLALAKLERVAAAAPPAMTRHDDGDDGDDASSFSSSPAGPAAERKSHEEGTLNVGAASSPRHHDAPSSMSSMSSSKEEDMQQEGRGIDDDGTSATACCVDQDGRLRDQDGDLGRDRTDREVLRRAWAGKIAVALGMTPDAVIDAVRPQGQTADKDRLLDRIVAAGLDPKTGDPANGWTGRRPVSALGVAGVAVPDLGVDRLADRHDQDAVHQDAVHQEDVDEDAVHQEDVDEDDRHGIDQDAASVSAVA